MIEVYDRKLETGFKILDCCLAGVKKDPITQYEG